MTIDDESWVGRKLDGRYEVERVLGRGGMGLVLAVEDTELRERFALKVIAKDRVGRTTPERRFLREAEVARRIRSPHVVEVIRLGQLVTGERYILMEYLEGKDLGEMLSRRGAFPFLEAVQYIIEACAGLGLVHGFGIIHRDIKPSNLFLAQRPNQPPVIKLIDFGISKYLDGEQDLTRTNVFLGSPPYMSPEQISAAKQVDARSDLFSLGVVFYQLITGVTPFAADNINEVGQRILHATPIPPTQVRPDLPWQVDGIVAKCLAKAPEERFQNAAEFSYALEALRPLAAAILERYLDSVEEDEHEPMRLETLSCSFTSSTEAHSHESGASIFNRARAIAARGYAGPPLVATPRPVNKRPPTAPTFNPPKAIPFGVPIPENPYFIGRDAALAALHDDLCKQEAEQKKHEADHKVAASEAIVFGSAGAGKTEFMAAYARRYRDAYPGGVLWLDGTEDGLKQIEKQLGDWKTPSTKMSYGHLWALLERPRALIVFETATSTASKSVPLSMILSFVANVASGMEKYRRLQATHHIVYTSRTDVRASHSKHVLEPIDESGMAAELLSIGNRTLRSCEPTLWRAARSVVRAMHGNFPLLQITMAALAVHSGVSFDQALMLMHHRLSAGYDRITSEKQAVLVLLEFVSENLSAVAKSLFRTLAAFPGELLSDHTLGLLAGISFAEVATAMDELGRYKLLQHRTTSPAKLAAELAADVRGYYLTQCTGTITVKTLAAGIAADAARVLGVDARFRQECLARITGEFSNMHVVYRAVEVHGSEMLRSELDLLFFGIGAERSRWTSRNGPSIVSLDLFLGIGEACRPALITELRKTLELAAPCLTSKPEANSQRSPRGEPVETTGKLVTYPRFLVQLRDAAMELGCKTILKRTEAALRERGETWLARRTYQQQTPPRVLGIHHGVVNAVAVSANGKRAVSGAEDGSLFLYDVESRTILAELRTRGAPIRCLVVSADGTAAISAAEDGALEVWNLERRSRIGILEGHHGNVYAVAISANGHRALTAAEDGLVCAWDVDRCWPLRSLCPYPDCVIWTMFVAAISFARDGLAIVASPRGTIWHFDIDTGAVVRTIEIPEPPLGFGHTPSRTLVYTRKSLDTLRFRDAHTGTLVSDVELDPQDYLDTAMRRTGHSNVTKTKSSSNHVAVASGGNSCFVASTDRAGRAYSVETGALLREFIRPWSDGTIPLKKMYGVTGHTGRVTAVASSLDGQTVVTGGADNMVLAWDAAHGPLPWYHHGELSAIAVSTDGQLAISIGSSGIDGHTFVVWDVATAKPLRSMRLQPKDLSSIILAGNLVYVFTDCQVRAWDFVQGTLARSLEVPSVNGTATVECVSSDGQRAVLRQGNGVRHFWDIARSTVASFDAEPAYSAVFLNNDHVLMWCGKEKFVIADFETASVVESIDGVLEVRGPVVGTCSNDRIWLVTANGISLVDIPRKSVLKTLPIRGDARNIAATPDGRFLVTAGDTTQVWSAESERMIAEIKLPFSMSPPPVAITPNGRTVIVSAMLWGSLELCPISPREADGVLRSVRIHDRHIHFMDVEHPVANHVDSWDISTAEREASTLQS